MCRKSDTPCCIQSQFYCNIFVSSEVSAEENLFMYHGRRKFKITALISPHGGILLLCGSTVVRGSSRFHFSAYPLCALLAANGFSASIISHSISLQMIYRSIFLLNLNRKAKTLCSHCTSALQISRHGWI